VYTRRHLVKAAGAGLVLAGTGITPGSRGLAAAQGPGAMPAALPQGLRESAVLEALPGKKPLIKLTYRPPNYETPLPNFSTAITPNDAFFVRYHLSNIPEVNAGTWKLAVGGEGANGAIELTLDDLKRMPEAEVVAVNQCSGNRRGLFSPHVPGVEWGYGAMGCARWRGCGSRSFSTGQD
jgi:DMSO/TMAO reductase YedYZ molybdopterin-dependent catalytic subunit